MHSGCFRNAVVFCFSCRLNLQHPMSLPHTSSTDPTLPDPLSPDTISSHLIPSHLIAPYLPHHPGSGSAVWHPNWEQDLIITVTSVKFNSSYKQCTRMRPHFLFLNKLCFLFCLHKWRARVITNIVDNSAIKKHVNSVYISFKSHFKIVVFFNEL